MRDLDVLEAAVILLSCVKSLSEFEESLRSIRGATTGAVDVETIVCKLRVEGEWSASAPAPKVIEWKSVRPLLRRREAWVARYWYDMP